MPVTRPTHMGHVVYRTRRFAQMIEWYQTVFGAHVQYGNPALAFLTFDGEHHRFAIVNMAVFQPHGAETSKQGAIGVDHVGFSYASLRDLLENYSLLRGKGIKPYWCIHHGITAALYYADPDGNQMEFQVDSLNSSEDASAFMAALFAANPIGVEFDPEDWLARLRAGTPEKALLERKVHEPVSPIRGAISQYMA